MKIVDINEARETLYAAIDPCILMQLPFANDDGNPRSVEVNRGDAIYLITKGVYKLTHVGGNTFCMTPIIKPILNMDYGA